MINTIKIKSSNAPMFFPFINSEYFKARFPLAFALVGTPGCWMGNVLENRLDPSEITPEFTRGFWTG